MMTEKNSDYYKCCTKCKNCENCDFCNHCKICKDCRFCYYCYGLSHKNNINYIVYNNEKYYKVTFDGYKYIIEHENLDDILLSKDIELTDPI